MVVRDARVGERPSEKGVLLRREGDGDGAASRCTRDCREDVMHRAAVVVLELLELASIYV